MKLARILFLIAVAALPFGADLFVGDFAGRGNLPRFQEFSSLFVYGAEALVLVACISFFFVGRKDKVVVEEKRGIIRSFPLLTLFLLFAAGAFGLAFSPAGLVLFFRLALGISFAGIIAVFLRARVVSFSDLAGTIAASALFQGILGILQFARQRSVGVWFLGEPVVDFWTKGVGRVFASGGNLLRAFGTTAHANIYAAFLVLGLGVLMYFFLKEEEKKFSIRRLLLSVGMLILFCALVFSFSRSGWIGAGVLVVVVLLCASTVSSLRFRAWVLFLRLTVIVAIVLIPFGRLAVPRAAISLKTDLSFNYRLTYNEMGLEIITKNPLGVGPGNQVEHGVTNGLYQKYGIGSDEPWNWQPIHNLYLLIASEAGTPALLALLGFLVVLGYRVFKKMREDGNEYSAAYVSVFGIFVSFLVLGLSDHYFWDLASGRLMFWLLLGIMMGLSPHRSMDRTLASEAGN